MGLDCWLWLFEKQKEINVIFVFNFQKNNLPDHYILRCYLCLSHFHTRMQEGVAIRDVKSLIWMTTFEAGFSFAAVCAAREPKRRAACDITMCPAISVFQIYANKWQNDGRMPAAAAFLQELQPARSVKPAAGPRARAAEFNGCHASSRQ